MDADLHNQSPNADESATNKPGPPRFAIREAVTNIGALLPRSDWLVVGWVIAIKLLLFVFGAKAVLVLANQRPPNGDWLGIWKRWDTLPYLEVARGGYTKTVHLMAYPLYPWVIRVVDLVVGDYYLTALIISTIALIFAGILLRRLVSLDFSSEIAERAVWFFLIFPTAYFLQVGYTESLFLCLALGAFLAVRKENWWLGGALGALATMTRANGLALVPAFIVEAIQQWRASGGWRWRWLWIAAVPLGFCVFLLVNQRLTGHAFGFVEMRQKIFCASPNWPWIGLREAYRSLRRGPSEGEVVGGQEFFFALFGLICALVSWFKLRPSYATWITFTWIGFACVTFIQSAPRYSVALFPVFILFGLAAQNRVWNALITMWSLLFLGLFASMFARGWWAF